eukprot:4679195-Prorocentrum_lima.AAC.1
MGLLSLSSMLKKPAISLNSLTAFQVFCQRVGVGWDKAGVVWVRLWLPCVARVGGWCVGGVLD